MHKSQLKSLVLSLGLASKTGINWSWAICSCLIHQEKLFPIQMLL